MIKFQFPSNGKADTKGTDLSGARLVDAKFQFPSNGKADTKSEVNLEGAIWEEFQFPSNGKADTKPNRR